MATATTSIRCPSQSGRAIAAAQIEDYARGYGLDFYPTIFEVVDADQLNAIAAYGGLPRPLSALAVRHGVRAAHQGLPLRPAKDLRDGDQQRSVLRLPDDESTHSTDQKLVMAHVYGHCDFFKNNYWFSQTNRKMMDEMANHGNRIRRYMDASASKRSRSSSTPA